MSSSQRRDRQVGKREPRCYIHKQDKDALIQKLFRQHKRDLISRGVIQDPANRPPMFKFTWTYGDISGSVYADTRSEARGIIKKNLGIKKKNRLPIEVDIQQEHNTEEPEDDDEDTTGGPSKCRGSTDRREEAIAAV